jgi:hypothetical protein
LDVSSQCVTNVCTTILDSAILDALMDQATQAGLIVAVILERPTCLLCIVAKAGLTSLDVVRCLERIGRHLAVRVERGDRCRLCGSTVGPVYSVGRPD